MITRPECQEAWLRRFLNPVPLTIRHQTTVQNSVLILVHFIDCVLVAVYRETLLCTWDKCQHSLLGKSVSESR